MDIFLTIFNPLYENFHYFFYNFTDLINKTFQHLQPWQLIFMSTGATFILVSLWSFIFKNNKSFVERITKTFFSVIKSIPMVKRRINVEMEKQYKEMDQMFQKQNKGMQYLVKLPNKGLNHDEILEKLQHYKHLADIDWKSGACSGSVYSGDEALTSLMAKVWKEFAWSNPLHSDVFCDVRKMEVEVVRMTCDLFHGDQNSCGTMSTGGTESILLACYAYRNMALERGVSYPEIVLSKTAHPAFDKAAHMFCMKLVHVPFDPVTFKCHVGKMRRAITKNTCLLVASAPHFPHGTIDPVEQISQLGLLFKIPVHVDCCLGGFLLPFMEEAGFSLTPFDFRLKGVSSISADTHKYGLAPKGSSVVMYRNKELRKHQYFVSLKWPGGIYASPTLLGSRAGSLIAACWATMVHTGRDKYVEVCKNIINTTRFMEKMVNEIEGVYALNSETSVLVIGSNEFNIYRLSDELSHRKWCLCPLQYPSFIHLAVTQLHTKEGVAQRFLKDLEESVAKIMKNKKVKDQGTAALYGMAQSIPDASLVEGVTASYFDAYYSVGTSN